MKITTKDGQTLEVGTRVFYTGDVANLENEGTVSRIYSDKWGTHIEVALDTIENLDESLPERTTTLSPVMFEDAPGRRFMTVEKRTELREAKIAELRKAYGY